MWIINNQRNEKEKFTCNNLPMLTRFFFRVVFLNLFVKFCAMCRIQNTCMQFPSVQPLLDLLNAALIELWRSDIKHKFCWGITCVLRFLRKKNQASAVSPSTIANAMGKMLFLPSCATATRRVPYAFRKGRFHPLALLVCKMGSHQCMVWMSRTLFESVIGFLGPPPHL